MYSTDWKQYLIAPLIPLFYRNRELLNATYFSTSDSLLQHAQASRLQIWSSEHYTINWWATLIYYTLHQQITWCCSYSSARRTLPSCSFALKIILCSYFHGAKCLSNCRLTIFQPTSFPPTMSTSASSLVNKDLIKIHKCKSWILFKMIPLVHTLLGCDHFLGGSMNNTLLYVASLQANSTAGPHLKLYCRLLKSTAVLLEGKNIWKKYTFLSKIPNSWPQQ